MGSKIHITITSDKIILSRPATGLPMSLQQAIVNPMPEGSANQIAQPIMSDGLSDIFDTIPLLKVVFDSAKSKGRMFLEIDKINHQIVAMSFLLKDNGEAQISLAQNQVKKDVNYYGQNKGKTQAQLLKQYAKQAKEYEKEKNKTQAQKLKELEIATSPSAKSASNKSHGFNLGYGLFNEFRNVSLTFYNPSRTAEFAKLKDPVSMPKDELMGIINSFGDRMAAALSTVEVDTSLREGAVFSLIAPGLNSIQRIVNDLFIAHGYNPLGVASLLEKLEKAEKLEKDKDNDLKTAVLSAGSKIEEAVPVLRAMKIKREAQAKKATEEEIMTMSQDSTGAQKLRMLSEFKSAVYDETNSLSKEQSEKLTQKIQNIEKSDGLHISVVIVSSLSGIKAKPPFEYYNKTTSKANTVSQDVAESIQSWNSRRTKSYGKTTVLFLSKGDRNGFITTGYNYNLTDSRTAAIYDNILTPSLKEDKYYDGIDKSIDAILAVAKEPPCPPPAAYPSDSMMTPAPMAAPPPLTEVEWHKKSDRMTKSSGDMEYMTKEPKPLTDVQAVVIYPESAKKAGIEGKVTYSALIGKDGKVIKVMIEKADNEAFKQPVIDAVMKTRFTPATQGKKAVQVWYTQSINFSLDSH